MHLKKEMLKMKTFRECKLASKTFFEWVGVNFNLCMNRVCQWQASGKPQLGTELQIVKYFTLGKSLPLKFYTFKFHRNSPIFQDQQLTNCMPIIIFVPDCQFFIYLPSSLRHFAAVVGDGRMTLPECKFFSSAIISLTFSNSGVGLVVGHYLQAWSQMG